MRYCLVPDNQFEKEVLESNMIVRGLFDSIIPAIQTRALISAVEAGVFDEIGHEMRTVDELSKNLSIDSEVLQLVLKVLIGYGYIHYENNRYSLTNLARETLLPDGRARLSAWVRLNRLQWNAVSRLDEVLKTGEGIDLHHDFGSDKDWAIYQEAMLETAVPAVQWVSENVPVPEGASLMLDIGGAHGQYGAGICRRNPPMKSEVMELPEAIEAARKLARREGIDDIVSHKLGNILEIEPEKEKYDVVFMGNILHHFTEEENLRILKKVRTMLKENGTAVIWDFKTPSGDATPDIVADGFALMFRVTSTATCY